jgi:hypothetical protein
MTHLLVFAAGSLVGGQLDQVGAGDGDRPAQMAFVNDAVFDIERGDVLSSAASQRSWRRPVS